MHRVGIIGSGNVGANTAFFIAERGIADVVLTDAKEGISRGKALDIMEVAPIRSYRSRVNASDSPDAIDGCDVIVLAAGTVRLPGMRRDDLFDRNAAVVVEAAELVRRKAPDSAVVVVSEPVDSLTAVFTSVSGLPRERVLGVGGILDATRLRYAVARDLGVSAVNVSSLVFGRHGEDLFAPARFTSVAGVPVLRLMLPEQFESLVQEVRHAGDFIVELAKRSSAYYAPSAAIAELVDALCRGTRRVFPVSTLLKGEYGIDGVSMSIPAVVGEGCVERFLLPELHEAEKEQLEESARALREVLAGRKG